MNTSSVSTLVFATIAVLSVGCTSVRLNPYGLPVDEHNVMPTGALRGCEVPEGASTRAVLKFGTKPLYPLGQRMNSASGKATVRFSVAESGQVTVLAHNSEDSQWFASHAAVAMRDWEVVPATLNGKPVAVTCKMTFDFVIQ